MYGTATNNHPMIPTPGCLNKTCPCRSSFHVRVYYSECVCSQMGRTRRKDSRSGTCGNTLFLQCRRFLSRGRQQPEVRGAFELLLLLSDGSSLQADEVYHVILLTHQKDPSVWDHLGSIHPDFDGKPAAFSSAVIVDDWISPSSMPIPQNSYERVLESGK